MSDDGTVALSIEVDEGADLDSIVSAIAGIPGVTAVDVDTDEVEQVPAAVRAARALANAPGARDLYGEKGVADVLSNQAHARRAYLVALESVPDCATDADAIREGIDGAYRVLSTPPQ